jgi:hypothetical protein
MTTERDQDTEVAWRKSSASNQDATCVEVAAWESFVLVRDSLDKQGAMLKVAPQRWCEFLNHVRHGS